MHPKHLRPTSTSRKVSRAVTVPTVLALAVAGIATPAFAGKPDRGSSTTASCSAAPSPVAQNSDYTLTVRGLSASQIVNVLVSDSGGTTAWQLMADGGGTISVLGHAYWTGTSNVNVQKQVRHGWSTVTTCSFSVV